MKKFSESQCLSKLSMTGASQLTEEELYRAAVFAANCGNTLPESNHFSLPLRLLLDVRILIANRKLPEAEYLLHQIAKSNDLKNNIKGDIPYLFGMLAYRSGRWTQAGILMNEAKLCYLNAEDIHRALRALINQEIAKENLSSFQSGPLKALHQQAMREQMFDLAGNIAKAEAIDALKEGKLSQANSAALSAVESYLKDACPEDASLANVLGALTTFLMGKMEEALKFENSITITSGKVKEYYDVWTLIKVGKIPKLIKAHPLARVNWEELLIKDQSVPGKILSLLKRGPASKYEIIEFVWGKGADNVSYESRLFSALYQIRKKKGILIHFNGEKYGTCSDK